MSLNLRLLSCLIPLLSITSLHAQTASMQFECDPGIHFSVDGVYKGESSEEFKGLIVGNILPGKRVIKCSNEVVVFIDTLDIGYGELLVIYPDFEKEELICRNSFSAVLGDRNMSIPVFGTMQDERDNRIYRTVKINDQVWMAENLNYFYGRGSWHYNNDKAYAAVYGRLYNWKAALSACPPGWHLPEDDEWRELENNIGISWAYLNTRGWREIRDSVDLKSFAGWQDNGNGQNQYGFTALPAGYRDEKGAFSNKGYYAYFWTASQDDDTDAWYRVITFDIDHIGRFSYNKNYGFAVRCVKN